uniref:Uncharacterized protein n=1 Tax=Daphnia galeata TaxID=27404 RepID=A0A8J2W9I1_9CRUS|nr:unnamed protein product [Daphnia galeata]
MKTLVASISLLLTVLVMAVQSQLFISADDTNYPISLPVHVWWGTTFDNDYAYSYSDSQAAAVLNYRDVLANNRAASWSYSFNPMISKVQQVHPYLHGFLIGSQNAHGIGAANTPASISRTKRKNVLHYKNGEFRPILCSPRLCLLERPMGESE